MYLPTASDVGKFFTLKVLNPAPIRGRNGTYTVEDDQIAALQETKGLLTKVTDSNVYFEIDGEEARFGTLRIKNGQVKIVFASDKPVEKPCGKASVINTVSKGEKTMANTVDTLKKVGDLLVKGVQIHSSGDAARALVKLAEEQLGESYPAFLKSELGKALAPIVVPAVVFAVADRYGKGNPTMEKAKKVAEFALLGASKDVVDYVNTLLPLFSNCAALSTLIYPQD